MAKFPSINYPLVPLKIVLFCWFGGAACLLPYMTVHMKELGLTVEEAAIIYTLLPVIQLLGTPLAGFIADKLGQYKVVLLLSAWITIVTDLAILNVPAIRTTRGLPEIQLLHAPPGPPLLIINRCEQDACVIINSTLTLRMEECRRECHGEEESRNVSLSSLVYGFCGDDGNSTLCVVQGGNLTIRNQVFHPVTRTSSCAYSLDSGTVVRSQREILHSKPSSNCTTKCSLTMITPDDGDDAKDQNDSNRSLASSFRECEVTVGNRAVTFWAYFLLRIIFNLFNSICFTIVDSTALAMADVHGSNYGRERFWAILGTVVSPATGLMVDVVSEQKGYVDYSPAFFCYCALTVLTCVAAWHLDLCVAPEVGMLSNLKKLVKVPAIIVLLIMIFWLGTVWGFIENFLFWFLEELGCPNYLMGLTLTIGAIAGLPFLQWSGWFLNKVGHINLLIVALFVYFVRCFGYSYIWDPWLCIPFEIMEIFTYHLMWVAAATYSAHRTPEGLLATVQGCVGGLHYGVGPGSGSFIGGIIMSTYGARMAFRVMGATSVILGVVYGVLHYFWLQHHEGAPTTDLRIKFGKKQEVKATEDVSNGNVDTVHE